MDHAVILPLPTTREAFLAWEQHQEGRYEFDGREPVSMNGGTLEHAIIESNLNFQLRTALRGTACRVFGATLKIEVGSAYRYPDAVVSCTDIPAGSRTIPDPVVIFEVVSPSSQTTDRRTKLREYRSLPSVQRYILLEQDECALTVYARGQAGWGVDILGDGDTLAMPEIGIVLPVAAFYEDVFRTG